MKKKIEILPIHGWAFNRHTWDGWRTVVPHHVRFLTWDRGYFGRPEETDFSESSQLKKVIVTHSFGLHFLTDAWIEQADLLVVIGGFIEFHPGTPKFRKRSKAVVQNMIQKMHKNPDEVLEEFYSNCYAPEHKKNIPSGTFNLDLLIEDLNLLHQAQLNISRLKGIPQICILHGAEDRIVPKIKGRELYKRLGNETVYYEIRGSGHALPISQAEKCWKFIWPEIEG